MKKLTIKQLFSSSNGSLSDANYEGRCNVPLASMHQHWLACLLFLLLSVVGVENAWGTSYIPTTCKTIESDMILYTASGNSDVATGKTEGWIIIPSEEYNNKKPILFDGSTSSSNISCLHVKADPEKFSDNKRVIHLFVKGITGVKALGALGDADPERGFQIGATEYDSESTTESTSINVVAGNYSPQNPVSCSNLDPEKKYIISVFAYSSDTYLYAIKLIVPKSPSTITFHSNGGKIATALDNGNVTSTGDELCITQTDVDNAISLPLVLPPFGKSFLGWSTNQSATAPDTNLQDALNATYTPEADMALYAVYTSGDNNVGNVGNTSGWWQAFSPYYTVPEHGELRLEFKNYTSKTENYHNWILGLTNDYDRNAGSDYIEYAIIRADNYYWGQKTSGAQPSVSTGFDWDTFKGDMDGADVTISIVRNGSAIKTVATMTKDSKTWSETIEETYGNCDGVVRAFLSAQNAHLTDVKVTTTNHYLMTYTADENGSIAKAHWNVIGQNTDAYLASGTYLAPGTRFTLQVSPNEGYADDNLAGIDAGNFTKGEDEGNVAYEIVMPAQATEITATFIKVYKVTVQAYGGYVGNGGTVILYDVNDNTKTNLSGQILKRNVSIKAEATAADGWRFVKWCGEGSKQAQHVDIDRATATYQQKVENLGNAYGENIILTAVFEQTMQTPTLTGGTVRVCTNRTATASKYVYSDVSGLEYSYTIDNSNIATITGGIIKGISVGTTTATVTSQAVDGVYNSATATITINVVPHAPEINATSVTYGGTVYDAEHPLAVSINTPRDGEATIYFTTDGTTPTSESYQYTSENISTYLNNVSETNITVKAIAVKNGMVSDVASKTFTFGKITKWDFTQNSTDVINFNQSTSTKWQNIASSSKADIYYSPNGEELTYDGSTVIPITQGIKFTDSGNNIQFNGLALRLNKNSTQLSFEVPAGCYIKITMKSNNSNDARGFKPTTYTDIEAMTDESTAEQGTIVYHSTAQESKTFSFKPTGGIQILSIEITPVATVGLWFADASDNIIRKAVYDWDKNDGSYLESTAPVKVIVKPESYKNRVRLKSDDETVATVSGTVDGFTINSIGQGIVNIIAYIEEAEGDNAYSEGVYEQKNHTVNSYMIAEGEEHNINEMTSIAGGKVMMMWGGWKYQNDTVDEDGQTITGTESYTPKGTTSNPNPSRTSDNWDKAKVYTVGREALTQAIPVDGFRYASSGNNDAQSEYRDGSNKDDYYSMATYTEGNPFRLPCRGSFVKFEPITNGTLTVYLLQNGNLNYDSDNDILTTAVNWRPFYIVDEAGMNVPNVTYATKGQMSALPTYEFGDGKTLKDYVDAVGNVPSSEPKGDGTYYTRAEVMYNNWPASVGAAEHIIKLSDGGYMLIDKAYTKYTFHVQAGKSYYVFSNASKLGFCGANFVEDVSIATIASQGLNDGSSSAYVAPNVQSDAVTKSVTVNRTFQKNKWSSICLPFSMTESMVDKIFGKGTELIIFENVTGTTAHFFHHVHQNIIAGYSYFIYPRKEVNGFTVNNVTVESTSPVSGKEIANGYDDYFTFTGVYAPEEQPVGSYYLSSQGNISRRTKTGMTINGYRAYLKASSVNNVKMIDRIAYSSDVDDFTNVDVTGIEEILVEQGIMSKSRNVYNINGQLVRKDAANLSNLPAGVYIVDGKKYVIK